MGAKKGGVRFGSYYPVNSLIHRLDPRAKILAMLIFMLGIFMVNKFWVFGLVYLFGFIMLALAHIPPGKALSSVRGLLVLLLFTSLINMFFTPGEQILWQYGPLHLTMEGLVRSGLMLLRLVALIAFSGLLTFVNYALFVIIGVFFSELYFELQTDIPEIIQYGKTYLLICTAASFGMYGQFCFERLLQATGRTVCTMITQTTGAVKD